MSGLHIFELSRYISAIFLYFFQKKNSIRLFSMFNNINYLYTLPTQHCAPYGIFPWIQAVLFQVKISKSETIFPNVMQKVQRVSYLIWKKVLIWKAEFWDFFFTHSPRQMCWLITYTVKMKGCETENLMFLLKIFLKKII